MGTMSDEEEVSGAVHSAGWGVGMVSLCLSSLETWFLRCGVK